MQIHKYGRIEKKIYPPAASYREQYGTRLEDKSLLIGKKTVYKAEDRHEMKKKTIANSQTKIHRTQGRTQVGFWRFNIHSKYQKNV